MDHKETVSGSDRHVRIDADTLESNDPGSSVLPRSRRPKISWSMKDWRLPQNLQWIPANFTWPKLKPVIRCAIATWISVLLFAIPRVMRFMGQVSYYLQLLLYGGISNFILKAAFLILIGRSSFQILIISLTMMNPTAAFLAPPAEPFMVVLERELMILTFSAAAWA
jgi:hypothetical protein